MAKLNSIARFLNKELDIKKISDSSRNGLQIRCKPEVKRIGFAVDACLSTFEKAKKAKVDLLIVHHGVKWKRQKYRKLAKKREEYLKKKNISLYGVHLPLDAHNKYGNNIRLANILNIEKPKKFAKYHGSNIGYKGMFKKSTTLQNIAKVLNKSLKTKTRIFPFGKKKIKTIGIVSGGGGETIEEAVKDKVDCLVLGEIDLGAHNRAKDYGLNMVVAGHYATETTGVKALMPVLKEKFKVQTIFIDNPTGL
jgi:dinuclear metal center YbgI/SA1388 family protein